MERQLVTKPGTSEAKANDYRPSSLSHEPHFQTRGFLHSRKNLSNKPKLYPAKLQTKLEVSQPGDSYEQETDQVDEQVMRMPTTSVSSMEFSKISVFPDQVQRKCSNSCKQKPDFYSSGPSFDRILAPQRNKGNKSVHRLIKSGVLQAKLIIGQPNGIYEQEADRVAEQVMRMPAPSVSSIEFSKIPIFTDQLQRKCSSPCDQRLLLNSLGSSTDSLQQLQRTRNNQAVQYPLKSGTFQAKLRVGQLNDVYEQEADRAAIQLPTSEKTAGHTFAVLTRSSTAVVQCEGMVTSYIAQLEARQLYFNFIKEAEKYGLPVRFMKRVGRDYSISYGSDCVTPLLNSMTLEEKTLYSVKNMSPDLPVGESSGIRTIYEESTHAYLDLVSDEPGYKQFIARGQAHYQNAPTKSGKVTTDPNRVFQEAAANYVAHRVATWWSTFEQLSLYIAECASDPSKAERIRKMNVFSDLRDDYNRRMTEVVFGYSDEGGFLGFGLEQTETARPMTKDMKAFLDGVILESKIPDRFEQVAGFQQMMDRAGIHISASVPASTNPAPSKIAPKLDRDEPKIIPESIEGFLSSLNGRGHYLESETRVIMEQYFGYNFSGVRIHTDIDAALSAHLVGALAYTSGNNIVFNIGQFSPHTDEGRRLIAHELTHVVQQEGASLLPASTSSKYERTKEETEKVPESQLQR